jgi:hypothetical protein
MADDLKQTGKPDDQRINADQDHELDGQGRTASPQPLVEVTGTYIT